MYDLITLINMAKEIVLPEGWEIDKIENGKIILKEVESKYPKTWEKCGEQLGKGEFIDNNSYICGVDIPYDELPSNLDRNVLPTGYGKKVLALCQLLICRNAYWGDWRPDWKEDSQKYCIITSEGILCKVVNFSRQSILSFPTKEMRDAFYENFKDLIEEAKDLL